MIICRLAEQLGLRRPVLLVGVEIHRQRPDTLYTFTRHVGTTPPPPAGRAFGRGGDISHTVG